MFPRAFVCLSLLIFAANGYGEPKPVPAMQAVPEPHQEVSFQRDGAEIARFYFGSGEKRPFVYPLLGPSGRSLTRMGHPHDPDTHSHHNSVWLSHNSVNGQSFWDDRSQAHIVFVRTLAFEDGPQTASVKTEHSWLGVDQKPVLREIRRTAIQTLENREYLLIIDTELNALETEVVLGQTPFGLIGVRMAKSIGVIDGGGTIRNSEGGVDEVSCFRKPARWVDYAGPITESASEGITLMDHPTNLNHPVPFHVRNDGWMGAALTFPGPHTIKPGEPLRLRYGLYVHAGLPTVEQLQARWESFAQSVPGQ